MKMKAEELKTKYSWLKFSVDWQFKDKIDKLNISQINYWYNRYVERICKITKRFTRRNDKIYRGKITYGNLEEYKTDMKAFIR